MENRGGAGGNIIVRAKEQKGGHGAAEKGDQTDLWQFLQGNFQGFMLPKGQDTQAGKG